MPYDGADPFPDNITALRELAWLLRNPHRWPQGFCWSYVYESTCAIGLCRRAYGQKAYDNLTAYIWADLEVRRIFLFLPNRSTPERVADAINAYILRHEAKGGTGRAPWSMRLRLTD